MIISPITDTVDRPEINNKAILNFLVFSTYIPNTALPNNPPIINTAPNNEVIS